MPYAHNVICRPTLRNGGRQAGSPRRHQATIPAKISRHRSAALQKLHATSRTVSPPPGTLPGPNKKHTSVYSIRIHTNVYLCINICLRQQVRVSDAAQRATFPLGVPREPPGPHPESHLTLDTLGRGRWLAWLEASVQTRAATSKSPGLVPFPATTHSQHSAPANHRRAQFQTHLDYMSKIEEASFDAPDGP